MASKHTTQRKPRSGTATTCSSGAGSPQKRQRARGLFREGPHKLLSPPSRWYPLLPVILLAMSPVAHAGLREHGRADAALGSWLTDGQRTGPAPLHGVANRSPAPHVTATPSPPFV